jgi:type IV secretory pathway VirJ component
MKLKIVAAAVVAVVGAGLAYAVTVLPRLPLPTSDTLVVAEMLKPWGQPKGAVFLMSGPDGYTFSDMIAARRLVLAGSLVVAIDTPATLAKGSAASSDCTYFTSDVEQVNQDLQRLLDLPRYYSPVIAGSGLGGTFAMAIAAQTPDATIERTIAVDPGAVLPMEREMCSSADHQKSPDGKGWIYGLQPGSLPDPIDIYETAKADPAGVGHIKDLIGQGFAVNVVKSDASAASVLNDAVRATLKPINDADTPLADLPITPVPAVATHDTMAIIISGDGGWRDIDAEIGAYLAKDGVPTVGIDSLRYFWHELTPEKSAADVARIIDVYTKKWKVHKVALVGYSFGADVLPAIYAAMTPEQRAPVSLMSLLAYSGERQFEIQVSGILGGGPNFDGPSTIPDLEKTAPPAIVQCVYGTEDTESACLRVHLPGAQFVARPGGHHFDDVYEPVAQAILDRIKQP